MILLADAGGSCCDWILVSPDRIEEKRSEGFHFSSLDHETFNHILLSEGVHSWAGEVKEIEFYGAGVGYGQSIVHISQELSRIFDLTPALIRVESDLMIAAQAVYEGQDCLVGILGTGSNACLYDGKSTYRETPSLGYILGDEGGGADLGKRLLRAFYYRQLPEEVAKLVESKLPAGGLTVVINLLYGHYHNPAYLASRVDVYREMRDRPAIRDLLQQAFGEFVESRITVFENYRNLPLHMVGGVAHEFEEAFRAVAGRYELNVGKVIGKPLRVLAEKRQAEIKKAG